MRNAEQRGYQVGMAYKGSTTSLEDAGRAEIERLIQSGYAHLEPAESERLYAGIEIQRTLEADRSKQP